MRFGNNRVFYVSFYYPGGVESRQQLACSLVDEEVNVGMSVQKSWRNFVVDFSFQSFLNDFGLPLRPGHDDNLFGLFYCLYSHTDGTLWDVFVAAEIFLGVDSGEFVEIDQSGDAVDGRGRLIESDVSGSPDS